VNLVTLDFETYYAQDFSLSKITTEEYIRDRRFEVIGLGLKHGPNSTEWAQGDKQVKELLGSVDFAKTGVIAHNTAFDGAILSWRYGVKPKAWFDTMCMGRALHGTEHSVSLKAMSERYGIGAKGNEVIMAKGKRLVDFTTQEIRDYARYCINDVELTYELFSQMVRTFPRQELKLIDLTLRMFIEPFLDLDTGLLEQHLEDVKDRKDKLLLDANITDKKDLMSNAKFATLLEELGVSPPRKISPTTGKETYAFAKSDEAFKELQEHEDDRVQSLVAARLGNKSTLEETRTQRFIAISKRGLLPVPIRYYAAHTGRWGGQDKINLQNLPSRGANGKKLKNSIIAPEGHSVIDADSSQIEARVLAWLAGQNDLTEAFARGEDVYIKMAAQIYGCAEEEVTGAQRFIGKTTILGAGYGMGAEKFGMQLKTFGHEVSPNEAKRIINIYRDANWRISQLWREAHHAVKQLAQGVSGRFGVSNMVSYCAEQSGIKLPSELYIYYEDLSGYQNSQGVEYTYKVRRGRKKLYGGKVVENVCQGIARCIIGEQMLRIAKKYPVVLTVHDSIACCVPDEQVDEAQRYVEDCMRWTPDWAEGLPINCESGKAKSYGECE
jgi:DNA polymerase I-like protein with 3'-5' exonuclease and polymerase domains